MCVGKSSRQVADARIMATAHSVADVLQRSGNPVYTLGRLLVLAGDALQSVPPSTAPTSNHRLGIIDERGPAACSHSLEVQIIRLVPVSVVRVFGTTG
jgi:hypothetical protein